MPIAPCNYFTWPRDKFQLFRLGESRVSWFCKENNLPQPEIIPVPKQEWKVGSCAYYRPKTGIRICLTECAWPAIEGQARNWNWPGSTTDREPYGVVCHELGHHADWYVGKVKGSYGSEYSSEVRKRSGEKEITSYCPNDGEWFAEMFRVFVTNPGLLRDLRPKTYAAIAERFKPVGSMNWCECLGSGVPPRIIKALMNKGASTC